MPKLIDKERAYTALKHEQYTHGLSFSAEAFEKAARIIDQMPTIEPEVRHGKGCEYCKGRSYTKKPITVITQTMKRVEVCFNFCPNCGRDMRATDTNVGSKGGADNG